MDAILRKRLEIGFALVILAFFLVFFMIGRTYPPRPAELPMLVDSAGIVFISLHLFSVLRRPAVPGKKVGASWNWERTLKAVGSMMLYLVVTVFVGMVIASGVLVYSQLWALGNKNRRNMLIAAVAAVAGVYLLFVRMLGVPLYPGLLLGGL